MALVKKTVSLSAEAWAEFAQLGQVLGHEDLEETLEVLRELGMKALSVTDAAEPRVRMTGESKVQSGEKCPACGHIPVTYTRECGVRLGRGA